MCILAARRLLDSAARVFFGRYGDVSRRAQERQVSRQTLYREAAAAHDAVAGTATQQRLDELQQQLHQQQQRLAELHARLAQAVVLDAGRQAHFASVAQAEGVSLPVARRLLAVFLAERTPSVAQLGRFTQAAARRATALLAVLDPASRPLVQHAAADELFAGRKPILMAVEPDSLCWVTGRLAPRRDGATWAAEFRHFPALVQLTRDAGSGLESGLQQVNAERHAQGRPPVADQGDHFHLLREGTRALRRWQGQAARALERAEAAQKELARCDRQGRKRTGCAIVAGRRWRQAEAALDRWAAAERAWQRVREALPLFTPDGALNTRARAEAVVAEVGPQLAGPAWAKARRLLRRPDLFTFLDRVQEQLADLPVAPPLRQAALNCEGWRRQAGRPAGAAPAAAARRGVVLVAGVVLALAGDAGQQAVAAVRGVLRQAWRASSAVEGVNSVLRMQQARHRRLSPGLLDLKRLYWNCRAFRTGKRRKQTPYGRLGLRLPTGDWWELLQMAPEQLRQQLSAPRVAA
jgi:hypothetical protein